MAKRSRSERLQNEFTAAHREREKAHREGDSTAHDAAKDRERVAVQKQRALAKDAKWTTALAAATWRGPRGAEGPRGTRGEPGQPGRPGATGKRGQRGPAGERGKRGERGVTGARGEKGERGDPGSAGITPQAVADLMETVRQLRADSEIQLQRIAELQAQLDITLSEFHRMLESSRRKPRAEPKRN